MTTGVKVLAGFITGLVLVVMAASCNRPGADRNNQHGLHITSEAIQLKDGWGYKIEVNNHPFIYQNQIPCIPGDMPFPTKESALAVAQLVMSKIAKGQLPSISLTELEKVTNIRVN